MLTKLQHLEREMAAGQGETAQLVARKFKKTPELQFKHKGNKKQFFFNDTVSDDIQTASNALEKMKNELPQEASLLKIAKEQLLEGTKAIGEPQMLIRITDMSECRWPVADTY